MKSTYKPSKERIMKPTRLLSKHINDCWSIVLLDMIDYGVSNQQRFSLHTNSN